MGKFASRAFRFVIFITVVSVIGCATTTSLPINEQADVSTNDSDSKEEVDTDRIVKGLGGAALVAAIILQPVATVGVMFVGALLYSLASTTRDEMKISESECHMRGGTVHLRSVDRHGTSTWVCIYSTRLLQK